MPHFYDTEGNPHHFVEGKNGEMRDATLRDCRKNLWVPGVSGVTSILAKPGLQAWFENQLLDAAWVTENQWIRSGLSEPDVLAEWKKEVKKLANERSNKARDRGLAIHDAIEKYIKEALALSPKMSLNDF